jgi:hypothetical protein
MVYAVEGFFGVKGSGIPPKKRLRVAYDMTTEEVYIDFTIWCIREEKNLDVLAQVRYENGYPETRFNLPTWAPDWTTLGMNDFNVAERRVALATNKLASPRITSPFPPLCRRSEGTLILTGYIIDTIQTGPFMCLELEEGSSKNVEKLREWQSKIPDDKRANRLLFGEKSPSVQSLERLYIRTMQKDSRLSHLWRDGARLSGKRRRDWHVPLLTKRGCLAVTFPYFDGVKDAKVCYLYGARSLFILRPVRVKGGWLDYAIVSGQCFIDGFEDGKGYKMARRLGLQMENIRIV